MTGTRFTAPRDARGQSRAARAGPSAPGALRDFVFAPPPQEPDAGLAPLRDTRSPDDARPAPSALGAVRDFLLAPPARSLREAPLAEPRRLAPASPPTPTLALLCAAEDARAVAVAGAALVARHASHGCALACVWTPAGVAARGDSRPTAGAAARRLAASLRARGLSAEARGRAAAVALPAPAADAVGAGRPALAAAGQAPAVLVIGGPRDGALDPLLAEHDMAVVLTRESEPGAVAELAVAGLREVVPRALARPLVLRPAARTLAASGLVVPAALRRALNPPLRGGDPIP